MIREFLLTVSIMAVVSCSAVSDGSNHEDLTAKASAEYAQPLRPGGVDGSPFWNIHSTRFTYAPAFDFKTVDGAESYRFTLTHENGEEHVLVAASPRESLSSVWNDVLPGNVTLVVEGLDGKGEVLGLAGERKFTRAYPFVAKEEAPARPYREAALKACLYVHNMPAVQHWKNSVTPDMSYPYNAYVCKIIGATIRTECLLARELPHLKDEAMAIALNAAEYLVMMAQAEKTVLEGWPPTYGVAPDDTKSHPAKVARLNAGKMMVLEASVPGEAYLDLYDATGDLVWKDRARTIAETFALIQNEDGSWPTRIDRYTGTRIGQTNAYPGHILRFLRRCVEQYEMTEAQATIDKAERYIREIAMEVFDLTGQFEDSLYDVLEPYSNLTNFTGSPYADYLLTKTDPTEEDVRNAMDLIRLSEDQFVHWDYPADSLGFKDRVTPCVNEQYMFEVPIDASTADVCDGYLALYEYNKDPLALAKATALLNALTRAQDPVTGQMPTSLQYTGGRDQNAEDFWLNCSWWSAKALLRLDAILNQDK